jgi:hypothetical protein
MKRFLFLMLLIPSLSFAQVIFYSSQSPCVDSSGITNDQTGTNILTNTGTVVTGAGKVGNAAVLDNPLAKYFSHADNAALSMGTGVQPTFAVWIKPSSVTGVQVIVSKWQTSPNFEYILYMNGTTLNWIASNTGTGGTAVASDTTIRINEWFFVTFGWDGTNEWVQVNNGVKNTFGVATGIVNQSATFYLGVNGDITGGFSGLIDDTALWKRTLGSSELTALYNAGNGVDYCSSTVSTTNLISWWNFEP